MKIGLLEDNPAICDMMQVALELAGHTVSTHTYGQALLETLTQAYQVEQMPYNPLPYDLLIVDINLPGKLSGMDVITSVSRLLAPSTLPIIVVSASELSELSHLHSCFPTLPIIRKPFTIQVLLQAIRTSVTVKTHC